MNSVLPFTYTLSAQVYVNDFAALGTIPPAPRLHPITPPQPSPTGGGSRLVATGTSAALIKNTGSAPAHRHYPNPPTTARIPAALPPSPCVGPGGGVGGGVRPHTSLSNRQPVKPFTYTFPANVYVSRNHISGSANTALATNNPTPTLPHRGREPFGGNRHFCHPQQNHRVRLGAPPPAKFINHRTNPHRSTPSPVGEGRGGGSQHPAKRQIQNRPSSILINCHRSTPSLAGRASVRSGTGTARAKREKGLGRG